MEQVQIIIADLDEIVFEYREKQYGSYILRKNHDKYLIYSLLIAITLPILGISEYIIFQYLQKKPEKNFRISCFEKFHSSELKEYIIIPKYDPKLPISYIQTEKNSVAVKTPVPIPNIRISKPKEIILADSTLLLNMPPKTLIHVASDTLETDTTSETIENICSYPIQNEVNEEVIILPDFFPKEENSKTEEEPNPSVCFFPSKKVAVLNLAEIQQRIRYPEEAKEQDFDGTYIYAVLIDENGKYLRHIRPADISPFLAKEIEKHLCSIKCSPEIYGDRPYQSWIKIPFVFKLY